MSNRDKQKLQWEEKKNFEMKEACTNPPLTLAILPDIVPVPTEHCSSTDRSSRVGKIENSSNISHCCMSIPSFYKV